MNKIIFTFLLAIGFISFANAQDDEKIKGDRNVTIKQTYIEPFNKIIVGEDFTVEIIYNSKPSIEIETDDNLHEYISFGVVDSILSIKTTKKITSSKKMNIKVNYTNNLEHIETKDDGEIRSLTSLELKNATLRTSGSSKAYLNIRTNNFTYNSLDKAKVKLNINANTSKIVLSDNCKVEALINSKSMVMDLYQRATANIEGTATTATLRLDNSASFNGKDFATKTCDLIVETNSNASIRVDETITIEASGSSEVYLYNLPKIVLNKFIDTAKLQKKDN